jgi:hypothetical protein
MRSLVLACLAGCQAHETDTDAEVRPDYCLALRDLEANCEAGTDGCAHYTCGSSFPGALVPGDLCPSAFTGYAPVSAFYQVIDEVCVTSNFDNVGTCDNYEVEGHERMWYVSCYWQPQE